jgi:hypothetical protein
VKENNYKMKDVFGFLKVFQGKPGALVDSDVTSLTKM